MQMIGQRHIDRINRGVCQQRVIAGVQLQAGTKDTEAVGLGRIRGCERRKLGPLSGMDGRCHMLTREFGRAKHAPTNWFHLLLSLLAQST